MFNNVFFSLRTDTKKGFGFFSLSSISKTTENGREPCTPHWSNGIKHCALNQMTFVYNFNRFCSPSGNRTQCVICRNRFTFSSFIFVIIGMFSCDKKVRFHPIIEREMNKSTEHNFIIFGVQQVWSIWCWKHCRRASMAVEHFRLNN